MSLLIRRARPGESELMDEWTICRVGGPDLTALAQGKR
jgi:hypothetical protein